MSNYTIVFAAALAGMTASAAIAQDAVFTNQNSAADTIKDLDESIQKDYDRDVKSFGNAGRPLGWTGSLSARATATSGNTDNADLGVGMRVNHFDGTNGHRVNLAFSYSEKDNVVTKHELLFGYDYTRDFANNLYGFGKATVAYDKFDSYKYDAFLGAGLGYRVIDTNQTQWSVQAGPGYRYAKDNNDKVVIEDAALSVSSYYSNKLTPTVFLTNDTEILASKSEKSVTNELGLNVAMTDALALRTSLTTEYDSDPKPGFKHTDNTLGLSVVYNFN